MKNAQFAQLGFILLTTPLAATAQQFGDFTYSTDGSAISITGYTGPGGAVMIPVAINGLPVARIAESAFAGSSLASVIIPGSVGTIGDAAFASCTSLASVTISNGVTSIERGAFNSCSSLTSVTIPGSVASIGGWAFYLCTGLTSVIISNGVTGIGNDAFEQCTSLTSITIPASVTNIGAYAFYNCTSLTNIMIPSSVTSIEFQTFGYCTSLTSITIPNGVTNIANSAFADCTSLISVTIPEGVKSIGSYAFSSCTSLANLTIPGSVTNIGFNAFLTGPNLMAITVDAANAYYSSLDGVLFNKSQTTLIRCPGGKVGSYPIPRGVTKIENSAFYGCISLTSATVPGSVTNISDAAFLNCPSLKGIFFSGNAPSFGSPVFSGPATTVYYLPGTTNWGATFAGRPTRLWNPLIQMSGPSFGVLANRFGFNITGTTNIPIVVESSTNLANALWVPLQSLNLTNGSFYFSDPNWTNYPARLYRIRSP